MSGYHKYQLFILYRRSILLVGGTICIQHKTRVVIFSGLPEYQVKRIAFTDILTVYPLIEVIEIL